jgi:hypothetical protein
MDPNAIVAALLVALVVFGARRKIREASQRISGLMRLNSRMDDDVPFDWFILPTAVFVVGVLACLIARWR